MVLDCGTDEEKVEVDEVEEDPWWFKFTVDGKFNTLNKNLRACLIFLVPAKKYGSWKTLWLKCDSKFASQSTTF